MQEFTGLSDGEGIIYYCDERYLSLTERKRHDALMKWVDAHEKQARKIICNSTQFAREQFCGVDYRSDFEPTFL